MPHELTAHHRFEVSSSLILRNNKPFLDQVTCDEKWVSQTTSEDQLSGWTERLQITSQSQTCTKKKVMVTGGLLLVWSTTAFWILATPLHLKTRLSKLMRCAENWSICSQHWSIERAQFYSTTTQDHASHNHTSHNHATKVEQIGLWSFASSAWFTWSFSNWLLLLQASWLLFAGKTILYPAGGRRCFKEFIQSWSTDFYTTGINKLTSRWQKYVDYNGSYFD